LVDSPSNGRTGILGLQDAPKIATRKKDKAIRVRIVLRRRNGGQEPPPDAVARGVKEKDEYNVRLEEIVEAFEDGKETVYRSAMEYVGYDHGFARELAKKAATVQRDTCGTPAGQPSMSRTSRSAHVRHEVKRRSARSKPDTDFGREDDPDAEGTPS